MLAPHKKETHHKNLQLLGSCLLQGALHMLCASLVALVSGKSIGEQSLTFWLRRPSDGLGSCRGRKAYALPRNLRKPNFCSGMSQRFFLAWMPWTPWECLTLCAKKRKGLTFCLDHQEVTKECPEIEESRSKESAESSDGSQEGAGGKGPVKKRQKSSKVSN